MVELGKLAEEIKLMVGRADASNAKERRELKASQKDVCKLTDEVAKVHIWLISIRNVRCNMRQVSKMHQSTKAKLQHTERQLSESQALVVTLQQQARSTPLCMLPTCCTH